MRRAAEYVVEKEIMRRRERLVFAQKRPDLALAEREDFRGQPGCLLADQRIERTGLLPALLIARDGQILIRSKAGIGIKPAGLLPDGTDRIEGTVHFGRAQSQRALVKVQLLGLGLHPVIFDRPSLRRCIQIRKVPHCRIRCCCCCRCSRAER